MSYAVLFKIYFVDDFVIRQLERLKAQVGNGHVYVLADETLGSVGAIPHDRVIRVTEAEMIDRGFVKGVPKFAMFWHSADYSLYRVFEDHPDYDYYVTVEYDAAVNGGLDRLVDATAKRRADFIGQAIREPTTTWAWSKSCDTIYTPDILRPYLNAIAFYSRRAIPLLRDRRLALSEQFRNDDIQQFPLSEAFIATELDRAGFILGNLSDLGDTSHFVWWPPANESELADLTDCTFIHPLLEGARYIASLTRTEQLRHLFAPDSPVLPKLRALEPRDYLPELLPKLANLRRKNQPPYIVADLNAPLFETPDPSPNIALGKPATQSSVSASSRRKKPSEDAAGAVNGLVTGTFGFHTGSDDPPWWMVDLEASYCLHEIWIFNRLHRPRRARLLRVLISPDGRSWTQIFDRVSQENFGGAYGRPLMIRLDGAPTARFVRIELKKKQYLHLDQVKIFGALQADRLDEEEEDEDPTSGAG